MSNGTIKCGWQVPGNVPDAFDWSLWAILAAAVAAAGYVYASGIPVISGIIGSIVGVSGAGIVGIGITAAAIGALSILALFTYYLLKPDGCIRSKPRSEPICCTGVVADTQDKTSTATLILAPFAMGPAYMFDLVLKTVYLRYITDNADYIRCSSDGIPLLLCIVEDHLACAARVGSVIGGIAGAIGGVIAGYVVGAALMASLSCGIFAFLCALLALLIAALIAAAATYVGGMVGGLVGAGIAALGGANDVEKSADSLKVGDFVSAHGDWTKDPDGGFLELFYVTSINNMGDSNLQQPFTSEGADGIPLDDCPPIVM